MARYQDKFKGNIELPPDSVRGLTKKNDGKIEELSRRIALAAKAKMAQEKGEPTVDPSFFFTLPKV